MKTLDSYLVQRCLIVTPEGCPCRFRHVAAVLRVPQSLRSPSLRSHCVPMERLMLQNLFPIHYTNQFGSNNLLTFLNLENICAHRRNFLLFTDPLKTAPAKCPPPVIRMTQIVQFDSFNKEETESSLSWKWNMIIELDETERIECCNLVLKPGNVLEFLNFPFHCPEVNWSEIGNEVFVNIFSLLSYHFMFLLNCPKQ